MIFVEPACGERDMVVTTSVLRARCACVSPNLSGHCTFMHKFQNYLAQLLFSRSRNTI